MSTIAAISTPAGKGALAVVRLSGPESRNIAERHTKPLEDHRAIYSLFRDGDEVTDEVIVTLYEAPRSYTGEQMVEIACHGSTYVQQKILQVLIADGARLAEAGEFTRRAFLNGRLDLSQAEAVVDLIDSTNAAASRLALSQLRGGYARKLKELREELVELTSLMELELDFSQEDVEFADRGKLHELAATIERESGRLTESFRLGNALKNGLPVAIVGKPNVGKSTLLNALLGDDRAIVSDIPGTTRDTVEDSTVIGGFQVRFVDTAGLRRSDDAIESQGIERSLRAAERAEVILYVVDAEEEESAVKQELAELAGKVPLEGRRVIVVRNKADKGASSYSEGHLVSAKRGDGLEELKRTIIESVAQQEIPDVALTNLRHYEALTKLHGAIEHVIEGLDSGVSADLVVIDLRDALFHIGSITGEVTSDEVLSSIFTRFCIGK